MWWNTVCGCGSALEGEEHAEVRLEGAGSWVNAKDDLTLPSLAATHFPRPIFGGNRTWERQYCASVPLADHVKNVKKDVGQLTNVRI